MTCEGEKGGVEIVNGNGKCPAVIICCMDYRFREYFSEFAEKRMGSFDLIAIPGGVQSLNLHGKNSIPFDGVKLAVAHHGAKHVWLFAHEDCGAYGGSAKFGKDREREQEFHEEELRRAESFLFENLPGINIRAFYAKIRDKGGVFEEI